MPSIKCGHCSGTHSSVADVRACQLGSTTTVTRPAATAEHIGVTVTATDVVRVNQFGGKCNRCSGWVPAGEGVLDRVGGKFVVLHPAECPAQAPAKPATRTPAPEGMHKVGDDIYKVQKAVNGSGYNYAKRLVPGDGFGATAHFVRAPGAMRLLSAETLMTLEEAKAWGALYGTCCRCGRTLTDETSIAEGVGPICAGKAWG